MAEFKNSQGFFIGTFTCMASPCEVLVETSNEACAKNIVTAVEQEALRIEQKFSRYRQDNLVFEINKGSAQAIKVDDEFVRLFNFAQECFQLSEGLFDITSGVLRRIWKFDGSDKVPSRKQAKALLPFIGWEKIHWQAPYISVPDGMEIDLGGIGKEYAVDSAILKAKSIANCPVLVNFGGDLCATRAPVSKKQWLVGVEGIGGSESHAAIHLSAGALATSGDARRFLLKNGVRFPHVLNPRTAWPVMKAPRSVTVAADSCIEAGFLSTMAMLKGEHAAEFLEAQEVTYWIQN